MKHILVLADGRELSSGAETQNAITAITLTESVNDSGALSIGSAVAAVLKISAITPGGAFSVEAGSEVTLYREDDAGIRQQIGVFILEKPERDTANSFTVTAYDRIIRLDRDITGYLSELTDWPYSLRTLAEGVCAYCGVEIAADDLPGGDYPVGKFSGEGITGRQLIQWIGQAACRFCRANPLGMLEFGWYREAEGYAIGITPEPFRDAIRVEDGHLILALPEDASTVDGNTALPDSRIHGAVSGDGTAVLTVDDGICHRYYPSGGLSYADFAIMPIDCVQIRRTADDIGTVYPETGGENAYVIEGNPLLSAVDHTALLPTAETIYRILKEVSYTPCKLTVVGGDGIHAGDIVPITDKNGRRLTAYLMTVETGKGVQRLECAGTRTMEEHAARNRYSARALSGKILELRTDVDGILAENRDAEGQIAALKLAVDGIRASVSRQEQDGETAMTRMTAMELSAEDVKIQVRSILENGADKITGIGYSFDDKGLRIQRIGDQMENLLNFDGMYVSRSGQTMLKADAAGVLATDVTVGNYLRIGQNCRLEDYQSGTQKRTACFYVG